MMTDDRMEAEPLHLNMNVIQYFIFLVIDLTTGARQVVVIATIHFGSYQYSII